MSEVVSGEPASPREHFEYNKLFETLVSENSDDESRLVGFVAYVFYKISKREYVENFYKHYNRHPNELEMRAYIASWTDTSIESLIIRAATTLSDFSSFILDRERTKFFKDAFRQRSFWRDAAVAGFGAFLYSAVLLAILAILKLMGIDVLHAVDGIK